MPKSRFWVRHLIRTRLAGVVVIRHGLKFARPGPPFGIAQGLVCRTVVIAVVLPFAGILREQVMAYLYEVGDSTEKQPTPTSGVSE